MWIQLNAALTDQRRAEIRLIGPSLTGKDSTIGFSNNFTLNIIFASQSFIQGLNEMLSACRFTFTLSNTCSNICSLDMYQWSNISPRNKTHSNPWYSQDDHFEEVDGGVKEPVLFRAWVRKSSQEKPTPNIAARILVWKPSHTNCLDSFQSKIHS